MWKFCSLSTRIVSVEDCSWCICISLRRSASRGRLLLSASTTSGSVFITEGEDEVEGRGVDRGLKSSVDGGHRSSWRMQLRDEASLSSAVDRVEDFTVDTDFLWQRWSLDRSEDLKVFGGVDEVSCFEN